MQAIILAGGFGTRLQSVVKDLPKPMAYVNGKPFLTYILDELIRYGFTKVILAVGYKKECIVDYFKSNYKGLEIVYSVENEPLGTGGCVKQAMAYVDDDFVFIINGDTLFKINYLTMSQLNTMSIACKYLENFDRYGEVSINEENIITSFNEKKKVDSGYINGGIYYLPKNIFYNYQLPNKFSLEKDFFEKYINELNIKAYKSEDYFIDIGIPEDYEKIKKDLSKNKALFLDRDGIVNIDYGHVYRIDDFKFTDFIFDLCKKYQNEGYLIFIITNQAGIGKGLYTEQDFFTLNNYMLNEFNKKGINITKVYYCPHKPEDDCDCRKPKPGMFLKAINEFNIEPKESIAIGDKLTDLEAAYNAGIKKLYFKYTRYDEYPVAFKYYYLEESKKRLYHIYFSNLNNEEVIKKIKQSIDEKSFNLVVTPNLDVLRMSYENMDYLKVINSANISTIDGTIVYALAKINRTNLSKFSGSDMVFPILKLANENKYSICLIGGLDGVAEKAKANILASYHNINISGCYSPKFGFQNDKEETEKIINFINHLQPNLVLFCCGSPKSESFIYKNKTLLYNSTYLCIGATIDFLAGTIKRAPKWMSKIGLEWLYRLSKEPKRLFKRYLLDFIFLIKIVFIGMLHKKKLLNMANNSSLENDFKDLDL